jgi:hypothetical protein
MAIRFLYDVLVDIPEVQMCCCSCDGKGDSLCFQGERRGLGVKNYGDWGTSEILLVLQSDVILMLPSHLQWQMSTHILIT